LPRTPHLGGVLVLILILALGLPAVVEAGKLSWLDEVVQQVVHEASLGGRAATRGGDAASTTAHAAGRLFVHEADESLAILARHSDDLARAGRRVDRPAEALLQERFSRLLRHDPEAIRTFSTLSTAEKRLVVEISETAQRLARRSPDQAEAIIRRLGTEGLSAVRVYGDDVAEVLAREGPESLGILRKTGRGGWSFFTHQVLPRKKKLAAAGVLAAFLANPEKFVDYTGQATDYAVREFARAGIQLAGAVGTGATHGLETAVSQALANHGLDYAVARYAGMALAGVVVVLATLVLLGLPVAWFFRPVIAPLRWIAGRLGRRAAI
jgi:hypothetical protein